MSNDNVNPKYTVELDMEKGTIKLNVLDVVRELNDEQREELVFDGGYWPFITEDLRKAIQSGLATKSHNSHIFAFREAIMTGEFVNDVLREFCKAIANELQHSERKRRELDNAYWAIYHSKFTERDKELAQFVGSLTRAPFVPSRNEWVREFVNAMLDANGLIREEDMLSNQENQDDRTDE